MRTLKLNLETEIPILGFGTWQITGKDCIFAVRKALEVGYRHIDTADAYGNHREVAKAVKESRIPREELFITTKVFYNDLNKDNVLKKCDQFLKELQTDYIDLLLIHWPNKNIPIEETLGAMQQLKNQKKIKAIGVSNFTIQHIHDALKTGIDITNNQIELHPSLNQKELVTYCKARNLIVTAYSPLNQGKDLRIPIIQELAQKYSVTPSQVILNWIISQYMVAIPKSVTPERIEDNFKAVSWEMKEEDIEKINQVTQGERLVQPNFAEFDS